MLNSSSYRVSIVYNKYCLTHRRRQERICKLRVLRMRIQVEEEEKSNIVCDPNARFRTIDGTCNNLRNPPWGAAFTPFTVIIPADFGDCISSLRLARSGNPLPNTRNISLRVHGRDTGSNPDSPILSYLAMNWGQFMDHDLSLAEAQGINCEEEEKNPECINIYIPEDDVAFRSRDIKFIELERDAPSKPASNCELSVRQVDNTITAPIDASNVYGSDDEIANSIRAPGGLMKTMKHPMGCPLKDLLPPQPPGEFCPSKDPNRPCLESGDERNNENQGESSQKLTQTLKIHSCKIKNDIILLAVPAKDWYIFGRMGSLRLPRNGS